MDAKHVVRVGSRKSELALIQTRHVISILKYLYPEKEFEIVTMNTLGDKVLDVPLPKIGEKSLFTKELEIALANGAVDFVVHSLKDLPTILPEGMAIGAVLTREDPRDALVLRDDCKHLSLETLPQNSVIGTSSLRRTAQLAKKYPHLRVENIRGNLNTRLRKLDELDDYKAIILAVAGLCRMGWNHRVSEIIDENQILYAVGQGALGVECREEDKEIISLLRPLYDLQTALRVIAERSFLCTLGGGCSAPVAVISKLNVEEDKRVRLSLTGAVWSLDGKDEILDTNETVIKIWNRKQCSICPYGNKNSHPSGDDKDGNSNDACINMDIECLNQCSFKTRLTDENDVQSSVPKKKQKLNEVSKEILKKDPHKQCPMKLSVGADFMGKCPYFDSDSDLVNIHTKECTSLEQGEDVKTHIAKCPFLKKEAMKQVATGSKETEIKTAKSPKMDGESQLYVGLVPHVDLPDSVFKEAHDLGVKLADILMKKGATEIMTKAQAIIRNN